jgi:hypothetical protein
MQPSMTSNQMVQWLSFTHWFLFTATNTKSWCKEAQNPQKEQKKWTFCAQNAQFLE